MIRAGRFDEIVEILLQSGDAVSSDPARETLLAGLLFWKGKMDAAAKMEHYAESEFLMTQWDAFVREPMTHGLSEGYFYALKHRVYHQALKGYLELYNLSGITDSIVLTRMAGIYKGLGDYERAIESLELASTQARNDPGILFQLADCYAAVGETKRAKLFFREAFYIDPAACDLESLEAPFIADILSRLRDANIDEAHLPYWLPVHASILGVFTVKRELKPVEIGRLSQSIRELEDEYAKEADGRIKALLFNRYLWMADHLQTIKAPQEELEQLFEKMQRLDSDIFECFIH